MKRRSPSASRVVFPAHARIPTSTPDVLVPPGSRFDPPSEREPGAFYALRLVMTTWAVVGLIALLAVHVAHWLR